jgi:hypothetical protein
MSEASARRAPLRQYSLTPDAARSTASVVEAPVEPGTVHVRRNAGEATTVRPSAGGTFVIEVGQTERIDVALPALVSGSYVGYLEVKGARQPLPVGSTLDGEAGTFAWQPAPGFLGRYELVFEHESVAQAFRPAGDAMGAQFVEERNVAQALRPAESVRLAIVVGPAMRMAIEAPLSRDVVQPFVVSGWALDLAARDGSGVDTIHVWAFPVGGGLPVFLGVAEQGGKREDVAKTYGQAFGGSAFSVVVEGLTPGLYDIVVYVHRAASGRFEAEQGRRMMVW